MRLAVVMPVWNKLFFTMKTVDSLFPATETQDSALVLVNDGSTDETQQYAGDLFVKYGVERVKYVSHKENMGVSAAWNTGIRCARAIDAEYIAIVNNDCCQKFSTILRNSLFLPRPFFSASNKINF